MSLATQHYFFFALLQEKFPENAISHYTHKVYANCSR